MAKKVIELDIDRLPLVSIIIPCFNYAHFLPQTLNSVSNQSYQYWECIIVDDGSTDNTREVVPQFIAKDTRFKYIFQENQGLSAARNTGLSHSNGTYIQFLDADDLIESKKLEFQVNFLENNTDYDIVYGRILYFNYKSEEPEKINLQDDPHMPRFSGSGIELLRVLIENNITAVHALLIRSYVFERVGNFDTSLKSLEDWDLWWRCAIHGMSFKYLYQENTCALYRIHLTSMSKNKWRMKYMELLLRKRMMNSMNDESFLEMNKAYIAKIKIFIYVNAWSDIFNKQAYTGVEKIWDIYKFDKRSKYLCDYLIAKYLPKSFLKLYYIMRTGEIKNHLVNKFNVFEVFKTK